MQEPGRPDPLPQEAGVRMSGAEVSRRSCGAITEDAHVRSDLTHLSSWVAGGVLVVAVKIIST